MRSKILEDILLLYSQGKKPVEIAEELGVHDLVVQEALEISKSDPKIGSAIAPKPAPPCKMTDADRRRGYLASREAFARNRRERMQRLQKMILDAGNPGKLAAIAYFLAKGSTKEFSVTVNTPEIGKLFVNALHRIGAPDESINFLWRHHDEATIPKGWMILRDLISFSPSTEIRSMRLRVRPFSISGAGKISGRSLGKAFHSIGWQIIVHASKTG